MRPIEPAVFLDRDGVINVDTGYVHEAAGFRFIAGVPEALARLQAAGWRLVVVTNQSGLARGYYSAQQYRALTAHMRRSLAAHGVHLDAVLHCPHLPDAAVVRYRRACRCRKPLPGLLLRAAGAYRLDLARSVMVGDKLGDLQAGRAAGVGQCLLLRSGQPVDAATAEAADAVYDDLGELAKVLTPAADTKARTPPFNPPRA